LDFSEIHSPLDASKMDCYLRPQKQAPLQAVSQAIAVASLPDYSQAENLACYSARILSHTAAV
jgi:hypothetical protein